MAGDCTPRAGIDAEEELGEEDDVVAVEEVLPDSEALLWEGLLRDNVSVLIEQTWQLGSPSLCDCLPCRRVGSHLPHADSRLHLNRIMSTCLRVESQACACLCIVRVRVERPTVWWMV